jgi:ParB family chromosome partitioning protein
LQHPHRRPTRTAQRVDADLARLQEDLAEALGAKVSIEAKRGGTGRVVIGYSSLDELDGLLQRLRR